MALMDFTETKKALPTDADVIQETEKQKEESVEPEVTQHIQPNPPLRPSAMTDEEYAEVTKVLSPDRIDQLYKDFDPQSVEPLYQTLYKATHKQPQVSDARKEKAARTIAGVTDALSTLVQGISGAAGAYIPRIESNALKSVTDEQKRLRDVYEKDRNIYDAGLYQSTLADIDAARRGYKNDRNTLLDILNKVRADNIQKAKLLYEIEKDRNNREYKAKRDAATDQYRRDQLDVSRMNAAANMQRANGTAATKKGEIEFFDANTGTTYLLDEKKFKANAPQLFLLLKDEILADDENMRKRYNNRKGKLTLQEQEDAVKKYMYGNKDAMTLLGNISKKVDSDPTYKLTNEHIQIIENMIDRSEGDEESATRDIVNYLKAQGFEREEIKSLLHKMKG